MCNTLGEAPQLIIILLGLSHGRRFQIRLDPINVVGTDITNMGDATANVKTYTS